MTKVFIKLLHAETETTPVEYSVKIDLTLDDVIYYYTDGNRYSFVINDFIVEFITGYLGINADDSIVSLLLKAVQTNSEAYNELQYFLNDAIIDFNEG